MAISQTPSQAKQSMQYGPGFLATFLYYFSTTAILTTFVASQGLHLNVSTGIPQQFGLLTGLVAGLLGGYFNRTATLSASFKNRDKFLQELDQTLTEMGYQQIDPIDENVLVYQRSGLRKLLSGKIFVQLEEGTAAIASRSRQVRSLGEKI